MLLPLDAPWRSAEKPVLQVDDSSRNEAAARAKTAAIAVTNVSMILGADAAQPFQALKNVNLVVQEGAVQLLMGPSGSGKTTLLSIVAGLLTPTEGSVWLLGENITQMTKAQLSRFRLQNVGFVFQDFNLFSALTAIENIELAFQVKGIRGAKASKQAQALLEQVGLAEKANHLPRDLSGGQKQRVAIARALAGDPKLIMADEPTAALDSNNGHAVIELLRQLAKEHGRTVFIVTHDPRIMDVADQVSRLEDGALHYLPSV
jgi:putative ABC transport system ATP-binding protein